MAGTTIYYASDVHGSDRCFRKFLNAAKFYKANVLIMGGDILGKAIVFLEEERPGVYITEEHDHQLRFMSLDELKAFEKGAADKGLDPYRSRQGEPEALRNPAKIGPACSTIM